MMRRRNLCALAAALGVAVWAAPARADTNTESSQTVFGTATRHGGYGAPELKMTTITGDAAILAGAQGGWIIDGKVVIGVAGYALMSTHTPNAALWRATGESRLELGYGGLRVSYVLLPQNVVHFTFSTIVGGGGLAIATKNPARSNGIETHDGAGFIALEPQVEAEINLTPYVRLALGASYRYLGDTVLSGLRASDLSGPAGGLAVKIGVF